MSWATAQRMKNSPQPVPDTPQRSSAHVTAPTSGVSPTRPQRLLVMPPVEVAVAMRPSPSRANALNVPQYLRSEEGRGGKEFGSTCRSRWSTDYEKEPEITSYQ